MTVRDVYTIIQGLAPFETQLDFDNAGLLIGSPEQTVTRVGVTLDVTKEAVAFAKKQKIDLIVSHHPVIFSGLKAIPADSIVYQLIENGIGVICAHTNLDAAMGGVNDVLAKQLGLQEVQPLALPGESTPPMGRIGKLEHSMKADDFAIHVSEVLHTRAKYVPVKKEIRMVALCGGAGQDFMEPAVWAGADALVTAEVKHHNLLLAKSLDFMLVDAGHFETEQGIVTPLCEWLQTNSSVPVVIIPESSPVKYC